MAIQPDNKVVLGGLAVINGNYESSLVRFNADGTPDTTFNGTGAFLQSLVTTHPTNMIFGISLLPDGQLVALTGWFNDLRVARLNMADPMPVQASAQLSVQETDVHQAPVINNQSFSVAEGSAGGASVGTVTATEPNLGLTLSYSIVNGNTSGAFAIDPSTGAITVANPAALDYEANPVFTLDVRATDNYSTPYSADATVTINLTDITDPPVVSAATFSLVDNSANGTAVGTVSSTNPDSDDALVFAITGGNTGGAFAINPTTGAITVANASALSTTSTFHLIVQASDAGSPSQSSSATVTINMTHVVQPLQIIGYHQTDQIILGSTTTIQVVIFSTATFDARSIDVNSIRFGATGTEDSLVRNRRGVPQYSYVDVNHDGRLDLVISITVSKTGLIVGDTKAYLTGTLLDGQMIEGSGAVVVTQRRGGWMAQHE